MEKRTKIILISSAVIVVGGVLISKWAKNNTFSSPEDNSGDTSFLANIKNVISPVKKLTNVSSFPLKKGIIGLEVKTLQEWLNKANYASPKLETDGDFGEKTEQAVVNMQKKPNYTLISEYQKNELFTDPMILGAVSKKFYDYFVAQTKTYTKTQTNSNLFL
jgi:peptidoglycan hydrolase-like protein with peptidoglycan-binding domain